MCTTNTQNQELTTLRDRLLPMLMNGQMQVLPTEGTVSEAEQKVGLAMAGEGAAEYKRKPRK